MKGRSLTAKESRGSLKEARVQCYHLDGMIGSNATTARIARMCHRLGVFDCGCFAENSPHPVQLRPSVKELLLTALVTVVIAPLSFVA